jgi:hypothetical protein
VAEEFIVKARLDGNTKATLTKAEWLGRLA